MTLSCGDPLDWGAQDGLSADVIAVHHEAYTDWQRDPVAFLIPPLPGTVYSMDRVAEPT